MSEYDEYIFKYALFTDVFVCVKYLYKKKVNCDNRYTNKCDK